MKDLSDRNYKPIYIKIMVMSSIERNEILHETNLTLLNETQTPSALNPLDRDALLRAMAPFIDP